MGDYVLFSRDETPTVEQTQAFVDVCETFIRRNPLHAIGRLLLWLEFCLNLPSVLWCCWLVGRKGIRPEKKLSGGMLVWLCVCVNVQICIWPSWCQCRSLSPAPVNPTWFYLPGFTFLMPAYPGSPGQNPRGSWNGCVCVCVCVCVTFDSLLFLMWECVYHCNKLLWHPGFNWF